MRIFLALILATAAPATKAFGARDLLPADYRQKIFSAEKPLVLEYAFGAGSTDKATLSVVNYPNKRSDLFFFHMHMDELTAKQTGAELVRENGGTFMYLTHASNEREMTVKLAGQAYTFDPNRIFTAFGLETKTRPAPKGAALTELRAFVAWILKNIEAARAQRVRPMVIALHNNTDDDKHGEALSILTEKKIIGADNRSVNANSAWDIDNFYIATLPGSYNILIKGTNPNISLRLEKPRDIGYLSNWMIVKGIEYLNVESQHLDLHNNKAMMQSIQDLFR